MSVKGEPGPNGRSVWTNNLNDGNFTSAIHWGNQGLTPYFTYDNWMDYRLSAPVGKTASADYGPVQRPGGAGRAQRRTRAPAARPPSNAAIAKLANIEADAGPGGSAAAGRVVGGVLQPRLHGLAVGQANPYMDPGPEHPGDPRRDPAAQARFLRLHGP